MMYEYSTLTAEQRRELVEERLSRGYPPHSPPHPLRDHLLYMLTASCYRHACHMESRARRDQLLDELFEVFITRGTEIRAWVVLPNHYHLLAHVNDFDALGNCFRLVHARMSLHWNTADAAPGRKVWYRFTDRAIRSEAHYHTTLNYIHYNPVKHGWTQSPYDWTHSSVHWYLQHFGREWLRDLWTRHPVRNYGRGWDGFRAAEGLSASQQTSSKGAGTTWTRTGGVCLQDCW